MRDAFRQIVAGWTLDSGPALMERLKRAAEWEEVNGPLEPFEKATISLMIETRPWSSQPRPPTLSRTSRSQKKGRRRPSAVRATLDDPPIHIRPTVPAISGCEAKEPFRFRPLRQMQVGTSTFQSQRIFCRKRQESGDKGLMGWSPAWPLAITTLLAT